jgi:hypothetical protein
MPLAERTAYIITHYAPKEILSGYNNISGDITLWMRGCRRLMLWGLSPATSLVI